MNSSAQTILDEAIDEVNIHQEDSAKIHKSHATPLLEDGSNVDSLALVRLLLEIERLVEEKTGKTVVVVDESAFEAEQSPFATVGTLLRHIESLMS